MSDLRFLIQKYEKSLGLGLEIKSLAMVLVLKIMEVLVLVLTTKSYLHHCYIRDIYSFNLYEKIAVMIN